MLIQETNKEASDNDKKYTDEIDSKLKINKWHRERQRYWTEKGCERVR